MKNLILAILLCATGALARYYVPSPAGSGLELMLDLGSSSGLTYTSTDVEFTNGSAKLKNQYGSNAIFVAKFNSSKNANWSKNSGSLTATSVGTSAISGGYLVFSDAAAAHISFNPNLNWVWGTQFAMKFKWTPTFSGNAGLAEQHILNITNGGNNWLQSVEFPCNSVVGFRAFSSDTAGSTAQLNSTAVTAVSGQEYEIEYNADWSGNYYFLVDGAVKASSVAGTALIHNFTSPSFWIGDRPDLNPAAVANFKIRDLILYDSVQHTTTYTPGYTLSSTPYLTTDPTIKNTTAVSAISYIGFSAGSTSTGSDSVKYCIEVGGTAYYYSSGWTSTGTCDATHSSSASTINSNITSLAAGSTKIITVLHSADGSTTPAANYASLIYR